MFDLDYLKELLVIAIALSVITCAFIQKTKSLFNNSKYLPVYSLIINLAIGIIFCVSFTEISFPTSVWVGLFSFIGADSIYKTLEGKLASYSEIISRSKVAIKEENIINKEDET